MTHCTIIVNFALQLGECDDEKVDIMIPNALLTNIMFAICSDVSYTDIQFWNFSLDALSTNGLIG